MLNSNSLELNPEKQSKFWAAPVDHYKASITAKPIFDLSAAFIGRKVLDVGAADGSLIRYIRAHTPTGTEISAVDLAPKSSEVIKASCTSLPFADGSFDTVFLTDIVEHLATEDLAKCLKENRRVLKSGGHMIICTMNDEDLRENVILCPHCNIEFHHWGHCQTFTPESLRTFVATEGFESLHIHKVNLGLLARRPWLARVLYKTGLARLYKAKILANDLIMVARKTG